MEHNPAYDFTDASQSKDDHYYPYSGAEVKFNPTIRYTNDDPTVDLDYTMELDKDYKAEFTKNTDIGTAQLKITATGNYTGSKTIEVSIKGNLADYADPNGFTKVRIKEPEIYTGQPIIPAPSNVEVVFAGKALGSKDYTLTCETGDNTNAGQATATITGIGNYYGKAEPIFFQIRPLNLETDSLTDNNYLIAGIQDSYTFCEEDYQLAPEPQITHNGANLTKDNEYSITYGDNDKVGEKGWIEIEGNVPNYEGKHKIEFDILPYDISEGQDEGNIVVEGIEDVTLEDVVAGNDSNAEIKGGTVVMSNLKVSYTAVDDETKSTPATVGTRYLDEDEYSVFYENNKEIGTAKITITGKGNFAGKIEKTFRIRGGGRRRYGVYAGRKHAGAGCDLHISGRL